MEHSFLHFLEAVPVPIRFNFSKLYDFLFVSLEIEVNFCSFLSSDVLIGDLRVTGELVELQICIDMKRPTAMMS